MKAQLEISTKILQQIFEWYKSAESKAQIILTVLGSFIVFSSGIILANPDNFQKTVNQFDIKFFITLSLTFLSMIYGVFAAFMCLHSRLDNKIPGENRAIKIYPEEEMYFFGFHAYHKPDVLFNSLKELDEEKQLKMYLFQIIKLSENVVAKHKWVNQGFISVCLSVFFLLLTTAFYLLKIVSVMSS